MDEIQGRLVAEYKSLRFTQRDEKLVLLKTILRQRKSTWVVGTYVRPEYYTGGNVSATCTSCKSYVEKPPSQLRDCECACQRGLRIKSTHAETYSTEYLRERLTGRGLKLLAEYAGMNTAIPVECEVCGYGFKPFPGNLVKGTGCPKCAPEKAKQNCLALHGVEHSLQRKDVQRKAKRTMRRLYGVSHALQNKELFDANLKTAYKLKDYKLGRKWILVQGFEPQALDYIRKEKGVKSIDIICGVGAVEMPTIEYMYLGKKRVYHPDIYIRSLNRIVEVKSEYTYRAKKYVNSLKRAACIAAGYNFTFLIMNSDGTRNYDYV